MASMDLKKSVHEYIDKADDRLLKLIKALVETYQNEGSDYELSEEEMRQLNQRLADHAANPETGKDWMEPKSELLIK